MIQFVIGGLFFILEGASFGANLSSAFHALFVWNSIMFGLGLLIMIIVVLAISIKGQQELGKLGAIGGMILGSFASVIVLAQGIFYLVLSNYIYTHSPDTVQQFSELPQNTQYAIYLYVAVIVLSIIKKALKKEEKEDKNNTICFKS